MYIPIIHVHTVVKLARLYITKRADCSTGTVYVYTLTVFTAIEEQNIRRLVNIVQYRNTRTHIYVYIHSRFASATN